MDGGVGVALVVVGCLLVAGGLYVARYPRRVARVGQHSDVFGREGREVATPAAWQVRANSRGGLAMVAIGLALIGYAAVAV